MTDKATVTVDLAQLRALEAALKESSSISLNAMSVANAAYEAWVSANAAAMADEIETLRVANGYLEDIARTRGEENETLRARLAEAEAEADHRHDWTPWLRLDNGSSVTWCVACRHEEQWDT